MACSIHLTACARKIPSRWSNRQDGELFDPFWLVDSLVVIDAPIHPKYRRLTQDWFMPRNLKKMEDEIRAIANAKVDGTSLPEGVMGVTTSLLRPPRKTSKSADRRSSRATG